MNIAWQGRAVKQLRKLATKQQVQIRNAVGTLVHFDKVKDVKKLRNHAYDYRLRVGRFRVFFNVHQKIEIVTIEEVKKRDERTY